MSTKSEASRRDYTGRINRVVDYIEANLKHPLTLEELSRVANFSQFHFHRIFRHMTGEPLGRFIQRLRVERAANWLLIYPQRSITDIALDCGFSSSAAFAKVFKEYFKMSASAWRDGGHEDRSGYKSKIEQLMSKMTEDFAAFQVDLDTGSHQFTWRVTMTTGKLSADVEIRELPERHVAYIRHVGPYAGDEALFGRMFTRLFSWAGPRGLFKPGETQAISVYHDDPSITEEEKLRLSVCMTVPADTEVEGDVNLMPLAGGKYAVAKFEIDPDQYGDAWAAVYKGWLPQSGYQPDDRQCFEVYLNDPKEHPEGKHIVEICVPVKPL